MQDIWRWWLQGVAIYPPQHETPQSSSPMQEVTCKLMLLDGLLCHWMFQAMLLRQENKPTRPRQGRQTQQEIKPKGSSTLSSVLSIEPTKNTPLQGDLFNGKWVDNRSDSQKRADLEREQPTQTSLFRQREIAQFGVRAHPQMSLSPHTKLVLVAEDPRTEEEKERDLQRTAEALTQPLFPDTYLADEAVIYEAAAEEPPPWEILPEETPPAEENLSPTRFAIYLRLVQLAQEEERSSEQYPIGFLAHFALTVADAQTYGLRREEIHAAVQIGQFLKTHPSLQKETEAVILEVDDDEAEATADDGVSPQQLILRLTPNLPNKRRTYLSLIQVVETHTRMGLSRTGKPDPQSEQFAQAQAEKAAAAGLNEGEIQAALVIARYRAGVHAETHPSPPSPALVTKE
jgi:hypothetical protein